MTAKEKLLEYVAGLTEEEAEDRLPWIVWPHPEFPPAPPEIVAQARAAIEALDSGGPRHSTEEVRRHLGLADRPAGHVLTAPERAAIEWGLADWKAGRVIALEDLEAEMKQWDA